MRSGDEFIVRRRQLEARPAGAADSPVTVLTGAAPRGWATGTALFAAISDKTLRFDPDQTQPLAPIEIATENAMPLPQRKPMAGAAAVSRQTRQGEIVTIGDLVAPRGLANRDAKGLIVGVTAEGLAECVLGDFKDLPASRPHPILCIQDDNLVALLRARGGEPVDTKRFRYPQRPLMRPPEQGGAQRLTT